VCWRTTSDHFTGVVKVQKARLKKKGTPLEIILCRFSLGGTERTAPTIVEEKEGGNHCPGRENDCPAE